MDEKKIIASLQEFFAKAPHLPAKWREVIVTVVPWLALVFGILGILGGISALGVSPLAGIGGVRSGFEMFVIGIAGILSSVLSLLAFPKLRVRAYQGWRFLFFAQVISVLSSVLTLDLLGAVVGFLIGFYFLFEVKSHYK